MSCSTCRYHSKITRHKVLGLDHEEAQLGLDSPDGEPKIADTSDDPNGEKEDVYSCRHEKKFGHEIGIGLSAGEGCDLYVIGQKRPADPRLLSMLARFDNVRDDDER